MKKIAFIGAGSFGFTRKLVKDILTFPAFQDIEIALMDINEKKLSYTDYPKFWWRIWESPRCTLYAYAPSFSAQNIRTSSTSYTQKTRLEEYVLFKSLISLS